MRARRFLHKRDICTAYVIFSTIPHHSRRDVRGYRNPRDGPRCECGSSATSVCEGAGATGRRRGGRAAVPRIVAWGRRGLSQRGPNLRRDAKPVVHTAGLVLVEEKILCHIIWRCAMHAHKICELACCCPQRHQ
jgi:hypothetical protein